MKRIAILTQPLGKNYGGLLQNFALQKYLEKLNFQPITISRVKEEKISFLSKIKNETYNRLLGKHKKILTNNEVSFVTELMVEFVENELNVSKLLHNTAELDQFFENENFDNVIVGSDQTWRPKYSPNIYNYYLDFLTNNMNIKKTAYASSFGTDVWEYNDLETEKCSILISKFDDISVREESGVKLCKENFNVDAVCVLDPTLLLDGNDYVELLNLHPNKGKGLYHYVLDKGQGKRDFISRISETLNLEQYNSQPIRALDDLANFTELNDYKFPSPYSWIQGFLDADFVVTDSFHGTVFSILFRKPFISIVNEGRGATRFYSLLKGLGIEDRLVTDYRDYDFSNLIKEIDYFNVYKKLEGLREHSKEFLNRSLF